MIPGAIAIVVLVFGLIVVIKLGPRLHEALEDKGTNTISNKRIGTLAVTAGTFILEASGGAPIEAWMLTGWMWGIKAWQRKGETNGHLPNGDSNGK